MHISMIIEPMFIGYTEIILIVVLALVFFGGKKIPELMRGMGRGVKEFKDAVNKDYSEDDDTSAAQTTETAENLHIAEPAPAPAKRRGRPRKNTAAVADDAPAAQPKRRGRPKKSVAEPAPEQPKRRPGRPKKINN